MNNEINAGSMADIAFLLLIFFLVTTTMAKDEGILVKLPPWSDAPVQETATLLDRNVYTILINADNELLVENKLTQIRDLKVGVKNFIMNPGNNPELAKSPEEAVVSLQNDNGTSYNTYIQVYNEIKAAYNELRDAASMKRFNTVYDLLTRKQKKQIIEIIPMKISEAEPTDFGDKAEVENTEK